jgi:hypothetical protein
MPTIEIPDLGRSFLQKVSDYLGANLTTLTCEQMDGLYGRFYETLKEFKGNANGFTGLSEYLIFRHLYHLLGGQFTREQVSKHLWQFRSKADPALIIGQSIRVTVAGRRYYPDIAVFHTGELVAVCSIKLSLEFGLKTAESDLDRLAELRRYHPDMRALMVLYNPQVGTIHPRLLTMAEGKDWFRILVLKGNPEPLYAELQAGLALDRVLPTIS